MRLKIVLDTHHAAARLAQIAEQFQEAITITDGQGLRANAKSVIGVLSAMEYNELWLESENEHYLDFKDFVAEE